MAPSFLMSKIAAVIDARIINRFKPLEYKLNQEKSKIE